MKKTLKGLSAILMTSVLAVSASAATVGSLTASAGSIKVNTAADTNNAYNAYPILTGTLTEGKLSNVDFGAALPTTTDSSGKKHLSEDLVTALKTKSGLTAFASLSTDTTPTQFADMIANLADRSADAEKFAKIIGRYVASSKAIGISTDATTVADGYYIVKEEGTGAPKTLNLLKVAGTVAIDVKETTPSSDKTVTDVNDSKNVADTHTKTADYDIGDKVPYVLTFTLPSDYSRYEKYPITFTDTMSAGLTYNNDAKIYYGTTDASGDAITLTATNVTDGNKYTYKVDLKALQATEAAKTEADQDANIMGISNGTVIRIEYTATLNDSAVIGGTGNPNTYTVEYANDPNWVPSGDTPGTPETPPENPPTGTTPESKNVVFTYQLTVNKKDDDGNSLNGATFKLSKWKDKENAAAIDGTSWEPVKTIQLTDAAKFDFKGLDDGIYKLEETAAPAHYNPIAPIQFEITAEHSDSTYTLGTVTQTGLTGATVNNGVISVDIENNKGIELPGTGGVGTTIFYIIGGLMISGALVLLIVRKRMSIKEK